MKTRILSLVVAGSMLIGAIAGSAVAQDQKKPGRANRNEARMAKRAGQAPFRTLPEAQLTKLGATEAEKTAIRDFVKTKAQLTRQYMKEVTPIFRLVKDEKTTSEQFTKGLSDFNSAKAKYDREVSKAELELKAKLSPKIQIALLAADVLENGLPNLARRQTPGGAKPASKVGGTPTAPATSTTAQ